RITLCNCSTPWINDHRSSRERAAIMCTNCVTRHNKELIFNCPRNLQMFPVVFAGFWPLGNDMQDLRTFQGEFRSEEHTCELQSRFDRVCRLLLDKSIRPR